MKFIGIIFILAGAFVLYLYASFYIGGLGIMKGIEEYRALPPHIKYASDFELQKKFDTFYRTGLDTSIECIASTGSTQGYYVIKRTPLVSSLYDMGFNQLDEEYCQINPLIKVFNDGYTLTFYDRAPNIDRDVYVYLHYDSRTKKRFSDEETLMRIKELQRNDKLKGKNINED